MNISRSLVLLLFLFLFFFFLNNFWFSRKINVYFQKTSKSDFFLGKLEIHLFSCCVFLLSMPTDFHLLFTTISCFVALARPAPKRLIPRSFLSKIYFFEDFLTSLLKVFVFPLLFYSFLFSCECIYILPLLFHFHFRLRILRDFPRLVISFFWAFS